MSGVIICPVTANAAIPGYFEGISIRTDAGFTADDNVTRAKNSTDKLSDQSFSVSANLPFTFMPGKHVRALFNGFVSGEKFVHYDGLSRVSAGVQGELQYRQSAAFFSPIFAISGRTLTEQYQSKRRDSSRYSVSISMRQPVTDRIQIFGALTHHQRDAYSKVFTITEEAARFNLDYLLSSRGTIYMTGEYRVGDIVSTGQPTLELISRAEVYTPDDAFTDPQLYAYRFNGSTVLATLGYNHGFSPKHALDFFWRRVESIPDGQKVVYATSSGYVVNQFSLVYLISF
ncbi:MAG: hypothetical protein ABL860_04280 [Candidatus Nitrotoga sp.]